MFVHFPTATIAATDAPTSLAGAVRFQFGTFCVSTYVCGEKKFECWNFEMGISVVATSLGWFSDKHPTGG